MNDYELREHNAKVVSLLEDINDGLVQCRIILGMIFGWIAVATWILR